MNISTATQIHVCRQGSPPFPWSLGKLSPGPVFWGTFNDEDMLPFLPRSLCILMDAAIVGNYTEKWSFREQVGGYADAAVFLRNKKYRRYSWTKQWTVHSYFQGEKGRGRLGVTKGYCSGKNGYVTRYKKQASFRGHFDDVTVTKNGGGGWRGKMAEIRNNE